MLLNLIGLLITLTFTEKCVDLLSILLYFCETKHRTERSPFTFFTTGRVTKNLSHLTTQPDNFKILTPVETLSPPVVVPHTFWRFSPKNVIQHHRMY